MRTWTGCIIFAAISVAGCGNKAAVKADQAGTPAAVSAPNDQKSATVKDGPSWLDNNGQGLGQPGDLFAAGMCDARRVSDRGLLRTAAQEDARSKLALNLQARASVLVKNYQRALSDMVKDPISESDISKVSRAFTDSALRGVRFVETWKDPATGDLWVLGMLPFDDSAAKDLKNRINGAMSNSLKGASAQAHQELDKAIEDVQKNGWPK